MAFQHVAVYFQIVPVNIQRRPGFGDVCGGPESRLLEVIENLFACVEEVFMDLDSRSITPSLRGVPDIPMQHPLPVYQSPNDNVSSFGDCAVVGDETDATGLVCQVAR